MLIGKIQFRDDSGWYSEKVTNYVFDPTIGFLKIATEKNTYFFALGDISQVTFHIKEDEDGEV